MEYYPKSQYTTKYTNGAEYALSTTLEEYIGFFYQTSTGKRYTGKDYIEGPSTPLILLGENKDNVSETILPKDKIIVQDESYEAYFIPNIENNISYSSVHSKYNNRYPPALSKSPPTVLNYKNGFFNRYFCKKNNEFLYMEISKGDCDKLKNKDPEIAFDLYTPCTIKWYLKGASRKVFTTNKNKVLKTEKNKMWWGFEKYFKSKFLEYYLDM